MPWRKLAELSPDLTKYLTIAVMVLQITAEIIRGYLRSQGRKGNGDAQ